MKNDTGIDLKKGDPKITEKEIEALKNTIKRNIANSERDYKEEHLTQVKEVLGTEGYERYKNLKEDFNNEITEGKVDPLINI